jgi:hypothetical protein
MTATESLFFGTINDFCNKIGTKRTCRDKLAMSALRGEADMPRPPAPYQSDAIDPKRTWAGSKSRSAAVCWRAFDVRWIGSAAPASIQNNSGLPQGLASPSAAG